EAADQLVAAGIRGILNFAPIRITVPEGTIVTHVDLTQEFDNLAYLMVTRHSERPPPALAPASPAWRRDRAQPGWSSPRRRGDEGRPARPGPCGTRRSAIDCRGSRGRDGAR